MEPTEDTVLCRGGSGGLPARPGTAALEFALVFGMVVLLLLSVVEFGLLLNAKILVSTAAREGARKAAVDGGESAAALARIREILEAGNLKREKTQVDISPSEAAFGSTIVIRVRYTYEFMSPLVARVVGRAVQLDSELITRSEKVR
jgi:hypothetical protein